MRIGIASVYVDDQESALRFYTEVLGFVPRNDIPLGEDRWLTVSHSDGGSAVELLLEPASHPAVEPYRRALVEDGIPAAMFFCEDVYAETARLKTAGVTFTQEPMTMGPVTTAVFDDTCGNLIQIAQQ